MLLNAVSHYNLLNTILPLKQAKAQQRIGSIIRLKHKVWNHGNFFGSRLFDLKNNPDWQFVSKSTNKKDMFILLGASGRNYKHNKYGL